MLLLCLTESDKHVQSRLLACIPSALEPTQLTWSRKSIVIMGHVKGITGTLTVIYGRVFSS